MPFALEFYTKIWILVYFKNLKIRYTSALNSDPLSIVIIRGTLYR